MTDHLAPIGRLIAHFMGFATSLEGSLEVLRAKLGGDSIISEKTKESILICVDLADERAQELNLQRMAMAATMFRTELERPCTISNAYARIREIRETMLRDLWRPKYLRATGDMLKYLDKSNPFGAAVSEVFPLCGEDIAEAHKCFAFGRYTASMFHLGRAMEIAVKRVAKKLRLKVARDEWQAYLSAMNEMINKMPFRTAKDKANRIPLTEITGHFFNFKEAWRNPTFHAKKTYTREEALNVLSNAGVFMDCVAKRLFKSKV